MTPRIRLYKKFKIDPSSGCWNWTGYIHPGYYGKFRFGGLTTNAHRASYIIHKGMIPRSLQVHHTCENKQCVNPDHLEAVTAKTHMTLTPTSVAYENLVKTHCQQGHLYTQRWKDGLRFHRSCSECPKARYRFRRDKSLGLATPNRWQDYFLPIIASSTRG